MTIKQRLFVKKYLETGNGTQAALAVYDTANPNVAKVIASENLTKPNVKEALDEALRTNGLTVDVIASNIGNIANRIPEKLSGDTVLKANVELLKLHGAYPDKKSFQFSMSYKERINNMSYSEVQEELAKVESGITELMNEPD